MIRILALDPGESTGWVCRLEDGKLIGGTCRKKHTEVAELIERLKPAVVVYESFFLYPGKARSLAWNTFYPCEVIGVIKFVCKVNHIDIVDQSPSVKPYFGGWLADWETFKHTADYTEHTKDAYQHLRYFIRNKGKKLLTADQLGS